MFENLRRKWNRYLERMAAANEKNFGDGRLDCCSMNKKPQNIPHHSPAKQNLK